MTVTTTWAVQVLDTGLGTPKHPLFLFGKKYKDADRKPPQAAAARSGIGSLQSWCKSRKAARQPSLAAMQPARDSASMQNPQHSLSMVPQSASYSPSFTSCASSLHQSTHAEQFSFQSAVSNGRSAAHAPANTQASMQSGADLPEGPSWAGGRHRHRTPMPLSMAGPLLAPPTAKPFAYPAASVNSSFSAESAIDLEAQNRSRLASHAPDSPADVTAAASDLGLQHIGNGSECGAVTEEPADVAAERAKANRLWAARLGHSARSATADRHDGESAQPDGPAILLHNLRKVCKAVHRHTEGSMPQ